MVTPGQAEELLLPLVVRAHALRIWPQAGFVDQAAEYLVRKLELDQPARRLSFQHRLTVERCKWIDDEVLGFLAAHPDALGVELGAGLSTRFQRLSARIDWPRFAWADVDSCDVIDCADLIFPRTDNYRLVGCEIVSNDWLTKTGWVSGRPLVVVMETLPHGASLADIKNILSPLINAVNENSAPLHLILGDANPALQKICNGLGGMLHRQTSVGFADAQVLLQQLEIQGRVLNEQDLAAKARGPLMHRLMARLYRRMARLYRRITRKYCWGAVHLRLGTAGPPSEQCAGVDSFSGDRR